MHWHRSLADVPDDLPTIVIAHEFFDALPVHQFQRTDRGWRERLVDVAADDSPLHLRLVLAPRATPASQLLVERRLAGLPADQSECMPAESMAAASLPGRKQPGLWRQSCSGACNCVQGHQGFLLDGGGFEVSRA